MRVPFKRPLEAQHWRRVAFIGHALLPGYLSTQLIENSLTALGRTWPKPDEDPGYIQWINFPVVPEKGEPVWVDFYVIPVMAPQFMAAIKDGRAYKWCERAALAAIEEAKEDGVRVTVGWGAMTKVATDHGQKFLDNHPDLVDDFDSTHGDAGTARLVMEMIEQIGLPAGKRVAVLGANGVIGDLVARALPLYGVESIMLVGREDRPGEQKNRDRLEELARRVLSHNTPADGLEVRVHQDKRVACHDHQSDIVIVATTGMELLPDEIPEGTIVLDITTPSACSPHPKWDARSVLVAGCGELDATILPKHFGNGIVDTGAGGDHILWGCTAETIVRAIKGRTGHTAGTNIPLSELAWCEDQFRFIGVKAQPTVSFGQPISSYEISLRRLAATIRRNSHNTSTNQSEDGMPRQAVGQ